MKIVELFKSYLKVIIISLFVSVSFVSKAQQDACIYSYICYYGRYDLVTNNWGIYYNINSLIPLYGKTNAQLTIKVYPAKQYYNDWMKETEYPQKEYLISYNNEALLSSVEEIGSNTITRYYYKTNNNKYESWWNGRVLDHVDTFNKLTGEKTSSIWMDDYLSVFDNANRNNHLYWNYNGFYFSGLSGNWVTTNDGGWADGWAARIYAIGKNSGNQTYMVVYEKTIKQSPEAMRKMFGLSWKSQVRNGWAASSSSPLTKSVIEKQIYIKQDISDGIIFNRLGLPIGYGMGNVDIYSLNRIVRNDKIYEYIWSE